MPSSTILNHSVTTWRDSVTSDLRLHMTHKLLQAIVPGVQKTAINDPRFESTVEYARRTENTCYENATSRANYYHLMAQKIYSITTEVDRSREWRKDFEDITDKFKKM